MNIFNSLGSNYNFNFVLKSLFASKQSVYHSELEKLLQNKYRGDVVLVYKGREAIELAFRTLNLPKDSFVAINGFTCFAVYEAIKKTGLNCEYLDIEKGQLNFSSETLKEILKKNKKIKVVLVQNTLGYPCQIEEISKICKENNLILIEDLAHCVGTKYSDGQEAGTVGDMTVYSFSQDKMIDAVSGGALIIRKGKKMNINLIELSQRQQIIDKLYPFFTYLIRSSYSLGLGKLLHFTIKKLNLLSTPMDNKNPHQPHELPDWYSSLIEWQFKNLGSNLNHRRTIASVYANTINPKILSKTILDQIPLSSNLRFPIFVTDRQSLIKYLKDHQIYISDIWYDAPIAPKKYLQLTDYSGQCPNAELASAEILNLPTHLNVKEKDAEKISELINQWLKSK